MQFLDLPVWRQAIRGLMATLCDFIYSIMSFFYDLFNNVSQINILTSSDVQPIYQRVTMILTIVMVFYITFQFVKYVVQPDGLTDKEKGAGNIVYKMVIVIVLIAFVPRIFEMAYDVQNTIISKNVISKVILGPQASMNEENLGSGFAASVFNMFYYVNAENANKDCYDGAECALLVTQNIGTLKTEGNLNSVSLGLNETDNSDTPLITFEFDGLLAVIVGGFIVYILVLYCIDVGARWVQLLYLQLIAPIPILGYMSPKKDGIFQKWTKQCLTTYLDLFLRVAIINLILLLCDTLLKSKISGDLVPEDSSTMMTTLIYVVLIMGVMMFAHKAPKMLGELFPKGGAASGNFGLSAKDRGLKSASRVFGAAAGGAVGAVVGAGAGLAQGFRRAKKLDSSAKWYQKAGAGIFGATKGAVSGVVGGAGRGIASGAKKGNIIKNVSSGAKNQIKASQRFGNREENGYGFMDQMGDRVKGAVGMRSRVEMLENAKAPLKRKQDTYSQQAKINDQVREHAFKKAKDSGLNSYARYTALEGRFKRLQEDKDLINSLGGENSQAYQDEIAKTTKGMKKAKDEAINEYINSKRSVTGVDKDGNNIYEYSDGNLQNLFANRDSLIKAHNDNNSKDNQIDTIATITVNGNQVTKRIADMTAEEFDEYIKQVVKTEEGKISRTIGEITQEQEAIKRQTSGSGINEGKK